MLQIDQLIVGYGAIQALKGITLTVPEGQIVTLIGRNGAGKTTTLRTISGLLKAQSGSIHYAGREITGRPPHELVKAGLAHVPEGRMIFTNLTVQENLQMGAFLVRDKKRVQPELDFVFETFPRLLERRTQIAGTLSGGEQQMLAIGRALMSQPRFLMLDEPSLGLAPLLVKTIFEKIQQINRERGLTILLVEQNANRSLEVAHLGYVLESGRIALHGSAAELRQNPEVRTAYLGG
ncbi:MAG TPA: ABC transporter ATP-binding protein [Verrucomicrobiae bacterium]